MRTISRPYRRFGHAAAFAIAVLSAACTVGPPAREPPVTYDLGPVPRMEASGPKKAGAILLIPAVAAPAWLDTTGLFYRLLYSDPAQPRAYANSRWSSAPAMLLTQRIQARFSGVVPVLTGNAPARADYALQAELEDFSQSFSSPDSSTVQVRLRATLVHLPTRRLVAQQGIVMEQPAAPNAEGAARALGVAGDAVVDRLLDWTLQILAREGT